MVYQVYLCTAHCVLCKLTCTLLALNFDAIAAISNTANCKLTFYLVTVATNFCRLDRWCHLTVERETMHAQCKQITLLPCWYTFSLGA